VNNLPRVITHCLALAWARTRDLLIASPTPYRCATTPPMSDDVFTARCYACAVLAMALCPSVRLSVCPSVRPSVRPSVTSRSPTKTAKRRITQTTQHDSPGTLVFKAKDIREIRPGSPPTGAPNAGGVSQNRRLSTNSWLYLENGTR